MYFKRGIIMLRNKLLLYVGLLLVSLNPTAFAAPNNPSPVDIAVSEVNLCYPRFDNLGAAGTRMTQTIAAEIDSFAKSFSQPEYSGQVGYVLEYNRFPLLSVTVNEMYFRYHAAHPMSYLRAFTFDAKTGETLQLADIFRDGADYRSRLNGIMTAQIAKDKIRLLESKSFTGIREDQEFYLTPGALVVYYQLYDYTAYAQGFLKFSIPFTAIADLLRPELLPTLPPAGQPPR